MSAISEVLNYFNTDFKKRNVEILMEMIFEEDGEIVAHERIKGERGCNGWIVRPEVCWDIKCNKTNKCYHIRFRVSETTVGDIEYFYNGKGYQNFTFIKDENVLIEAVTEFIQGNNLSNLEH